MKSLLKAMVASKLTLSLNDLKINLEEVNELKLSVSLWVWANDAISSQKSIVLDTRYNCGEKEVGKNQNNLKDYGKGLA